MDCISPVGPVYQAGTLSGNPLAMASGLATLKILRDTNPYPQLNTVTSRLCDGLRSACQSAGVPHWVAQVGSMFTLFFTSTQVTNFPTAVTSDTQRFAKYFWGMINRGVYLPCSQYEANFVSAAHSDADIEHVIQSARDVLGTLG